MNKYAKIAIVAALLAGVGVVLTTKQRGGRASPEAGRGASSLPRLVDLGAGKCIPCKMMAPILEELNEEYADRMEVQVIDVWENPDAGREYKVNIIPTQIFYDASGKERFRHEGFYSKEDILEKCEELGFNLDKEGPNE